MSGAAEITELQRHFPNLWRNTESLVRVLLYRLEVEDGDAEVIVTDLMRRFAGLRAILPTDPNSQTHLDFAALMLDAINAGRRLFAAHYGFFPGEALVIGRRRRYALSIRSWSNCRPWLGILKQMPMGPRAERS